ncbi:MAG: GTP-binding protein [Planctomycetaceae bacterium]
MSSNVTIPGHGYMPELMVYGTSLRRMTASGRGAVAVLQLSGDDGTAIDQCFESASGTLSPDVEVNRVRYGRWGGEDVVIVRTGSQQWEIHCHGGETAVERIAADLKNHISHRPAADSPDTELSLHGRVSAELLRRLLKCRTQKTAAYLLAQQQGVLQRFLDQILLSPSTPERDVQIEQFLSWRRFAEHLTVPWRVAIVGRPNAGKSRLLNAIVGYERSIVFDQPGTTRDLVEVDTVLDGWPVQVVDTAGIRSQATDAIESVGVESARVSLKECDACLLVVDSLVGWTSLDSRLLHDIPTTTPTMVLLNKVDLRNAAMDDVADLRQLLTQTQSTTGPRDTKITELLKISAATGQGLQQLLEWLPKILVPKSPGLHEPIPVVDEALHTVTALQTA